MPQAGFETMIPVFERSKTSRALDRAAIGNDLFLDLVPSFEILCCSFTYLKQIFQPPYNGHCDINGIVDVGGLPSTIKIPIFTLATPGGAIRRTLTVPSLTHH
jgi:hypothetical protein